MDYAKVASQALFAAFAVTCLWSIILFFKKRHPVRMLNMFGWVAILAMTVAIAVSITLVIIHDIHAVLMLIPGQDSEAIYKAPTEIAFYYAFIFIPLVEGRDYKKN